MAESSGNQTVDRTKSGRRLADQAREVEQKRDEKQREFADGRKRFTEGK